MELRPVGGDRTVGGRKLKMGSCGPVLPSNRDTSLAVPRILAVIPGDGRGSPLIGARRQVESLRALGIQVDVHFFDARLSFSGIVRNCQALRSLVRDRRPDLVHVHYGTITGLATALTTRAPLVITFRGSDLQPEPGIGKLRIWIGMLFSQLASLRADHAICVSNRLKRRLWWRRDRAIVLPTGVNLDRFQAGSKAEARKILGWGCNENIVLFNAGKAPLTKGLDIAEDAVSHAIGEFGPIRLEIIRGDVPQDKVPVLMNAADCLLVASRTEASPGIVKEALACNLPIVSVDVGDVAERLTGVTPSYIVERDPDRIASALIDVISNKRRSNGRERVAELSEDRIAERLLSIYLAILPYRKQDAHSASASDVVKPDNPLIQSQCDSPF